MVTAAVNSSVAAEPEIIPDQYFEQAWQQIQQQQREVSSQALLQAAKQGDYAAVLVVAANILSSESTSSQSLQIVERLLQPLAERGKPEAQFLLAKLYLQQEYFFPVKAQTLLAELALIDWVPALKLLAQQSQQSKPQQQQQAETLWRRAADLGDAEAQYRLAKLMAVQKRSVQAGLWLRRAAGQGYVPAMLELARHAEDNNVTADALLWYSRAAALNNADALAAMSHIYALGKGVQVNLISAIDLLLKSGLSELDALQLLSYQLAAKLTKQPVYQASATALYQRGFAYKLGSSAQPDYLEAREYYYRAALKGHLPAFNSIGVLFEKGLGVVADRDKAEVFYLYAAQQGYEKSMLNLAQLYIEQERFAQAGSWLEQVRTHSPRLVRVRKALQRAVADMD